MCHASFDYESVLLTEEDKRSIPDVVLRDLSERVYDTGDKILELQSERVQVFEGRRIQEIDGLSFTQFDEDGVITVEGSAGFATRDLDTDDILLSGEVNIFITENSYSISGEQFLFSPDQDLIWSPAGFEVELVKEDGSRLNGRGFVVDLLLQELRFDGGASGVLAEDLANDLTDEESE